MMNLKMITYKLNDIQFLVDAETNEEAVQKAIHANCNAYLLNEFDSGKDKKDIKNNTNYTVENIKSMEELFFICHFKECIGIDNYETIVYLY